MREGKKWRIDARCGTGDDSPSSRHTNKFVISWFLIICFEANGSM